MAERLRTEHLEVRTTGIREWHRGEVHYNRCEATSRPWINSLRHIVWIRRMSLWTLAAGGPYNLLSTTNLKSR